MTLLRPYRYFVAAVEARSLSAAAQVLGVSVAAVSKQVSALETSVSAQLLERTAIGVRPTLLGKSFYTHCRETLLSVEAAEDRLRDEQQAMCGRISLTLSRSLAGAAVFDCLGVFTSTHSDVLLDLRFDESLQNPTDMDFALRVGRTDDRQQNVALRLRRVRPVLVASPALVSKQLRQRKSATYAMIATEPDTLSPAVKRKLKQHAMLGKDTPMHTANDLDGVYRAVRAGLAVGVLLDFAVEADLQRGSLVDLSIDDPLPAKTLHLVYSRSRPQLKRHVAFKEHIVRTLRSH